MSKLEGVRVPRLRLHTYEYGFTSAQNLFQFHRKHKAWVATSAMPGLGSTHDRPTDQLFDMQPGQSLPRASPVKHKHHIRIRTFASIFEDPDSDHPCSLKNVRALGFPLQVMICGSTRSRASFLQLRRCFALERPGKGTIRFELEDDTLLRGIEDEFLIRGLGVRCLQIKTTKELKQLVSIRINL